MSHIVSQDADGGYEPTHSTRFYPGSNLTEERRRSLLAYEVDLDDATVDDIFFSAASAYTGMLYAMVGLIEERWGTPAAHEVVNELGARNCRRNMEKWLARHGVDEGNPLLMAKFEDYQHAMRGPDHAAAVTSFDDTHVTIRRHRCALHTSRPEGAESYCRHNQRYAAEAYGDADPALKEVWVPRCMSWGDTSCEHVFWYDTPSALADESYRLVWRRSEAERSLPGAPAGSSDTPT